MFEIQETAFLIRPIKAFAYSKYLLQIFDFLGESNAAGLNQDGGGGKARKN